VTERLAERTWREHRGGRPEWMTDAECELVAERTRMAMAEAGVPLTWHPADNPREAFIGDRPVVGWERRTFKRARRLAMASIGAVLIEDEEYADA
jgi:hypothetical protein